MFARLNVFFLMIGVLLTAGCVQDGVALRYTVSNPDVLAPSGAKTVCIVNIKDNRGILDIGVRRDGTVMETPDNVSLWFSKAIGARLADLGFLVTHAPSLELAQMNQPDYILSGEVQKAWIAETAFSAYEAQLVLFVSLRGKNGVVSTNTLHSSASKTLLPLKEKPDLVLRKAMDSLLDPLSQFVMQRIK